MYILWLSIIYFRHYIELLVVSILAQCLHFWMVPCKNHNWYDRVGLYVQRDIVITTRFLPNPAKLIIYGTSSGHINSDGMVDAKYSFQFSMFVSAVHCKMSFNVCRRSSTPLLDIFSPNLWRMWLMSRNLLPLTCGQGRAQEWRASWSFHTFLNFFKHLWNVKYMESERVITYQRSESNHTILMCPDT